jgi:hypothetical protein
MRAVVSLPFACVLSFSLSVLALAGCTSGRRAVEIPDVMLLDGGPSEDAFVGTDIGPRPDSGPPLSDVLIYAHSRDTLYSFNAFTNSVLTVGTFTLATGEVPPNMVDLAVNRDGRIFTSSSHTLYTVDEATARLTPVADFDVTTASFFALTFVTQGEIHTDRETLVGATNEGVYYEIDPATAHTTMLGAYPDGWLSSGDLVSVEGLGTYATIRRSGDTHDTLAHITFSGGSSTIMVLGPIVEGSTEYTQIFGLGYWGRALYGFSDAGQLIEINRDSGAGHLVSDSTGASQFWGAGVTTRAPVVF